MNATITTEHAMQLRLLATALGLQQETKTPAHILAIPGTDRVVVIGTPEEVQGLLELAPAVSTTRATSSDHHPWAGLSGLPDVAFDESEGGHHD